MKGTIPVDQVHRYTATRQSSGPDRKIRHTGDRLEWWKMNQHILFRRTGACITAMLIATASQADEPHAHRPQTSHVHGSATLNLVADGEVVHIELISPAANLVGFEHVPVSETEHAAHNDALSALEKADQLFEFNKAADCRAEQVEVLSESMPALEPADQDMHRHQEEDPDKHGDSRHFDITATYRFSCNNPGVLDTLRVGLFNAFPAIEDLDVQYIIGGQQRAANLTRGTPILVF